MVAGNGSATGGNAEGDQLRIAPPTESSIAKASAAIRSGKLVVIPTETVYGLAADATKREAVLSIFRAKGRPLENPLIVHVGYPNWVGSLVESIPDAAQRLMDSFWPGPLTIVLRKRAVVLDEVTAGLGTVAVRMPSSPIALAVIRGAGVPIAAPSANKFMALSPTRAEDVDPELAAHAEMVLDGGPCEVGLESTVVDCTELTPRVLRPGRISKADIERVLGLRIDQGSGTEKRSPGQYPRHYAPRTPVRLVDRVPDNSPGVVFGMQRNSSQFSMPDDPDAFGAMLYNTLSQMDRQGLGEILVEKPPETSEWEAVWDRLRKATG